MSTTDDECRSDAFVRPFVRSFSFVFVHRRILMEYPRAQYEYGRAIAPSRHTGTSRPSWSHTYSNHTNPIYSYTYHQNEKKTMHRHTRGERGLDRWASSTSHDSTDRSTPRSIASATRRADATRRRATAMALRDASNDASVGGQPPGSAAKLRELQSRCVSNDRPIDRSRARRRHSPRGIRMETTATDGLFAPRRARARRMDRMRRMSASGDGTMSARKQAPSSARRLSRPSAYGACDARWDDDLIRARWKRTNE